MAKRSAAFFSSSGAKRSRIGSANRRRTSDIFSTPAAFTRRCVCGSSWSPVVPGSGVTVPYEGLSYQRVECRRDIFLDHPLDVRSVTDPGGWQKALDSACYELTLILAVIPSTTSAIGFLL